MTIINKPVKIISIIVIFILSITNNKNAQLDFDNIPDDSYYPGIIRIKFDPDFEKSLKSIDFELTDNNIIKTGFSSIDELNKSYKVYKYEPILKTLYKVSEASLKNRGKHKEWGFHLWYDIKLDAGADIIDAVAEFERLEEIKIAEPAFKIKLNKPVDSGPIKKEGADSVWTPDDPHYNSQWHFKNTGQTIGGQAGIPGWDCNAGPAWNIEKGDTNVIVAIIDTGMEYTHEDLAGNMWPDIGPEGTGTTPGSHGTHVGGTVAAVTNNNLGVAGLAGGSGSDDGVRLMSIDIFNGILNIYESFVYAADNGAAISQNSWTYGAGGPFPPSTQQAIDYFNEHGGGNALNGGITIFGASNDNSSAPAYPAAYEGTISVAAHDNKAVKAGFSNYGDWVDIIAPGVNVASTETGNSYSFKSGTSMSCPHVSGAAALIVSNAYGILTNQELKEILIDNTNEDIYEENPSYIGQLGSGALDIYSALKSINNKVNFDIVNQDGDPITEAVITLDGKENKKGNYVFYVKNGTYDYTIEKEGYLTIEDEITVEDDKTVEVIMTKTYKVNFNIKNEEGKEITEAIVTLDSKENEKGDYVFYVKKGTYDYIIEKEGYLNYKDEISVEDNTTIDVTIAEAYTVNFDIYDEYGNVVKNAIITFDGKEKEEGNYIIENIAEGTYDYIVKKEGYHTVNNTITVKSNYIAKVIMYADGTNIGKHEKVKLSVFPNPTRDIFNIESNEKIKEITMIDIKGQVIRSIPLNSLTSEINVSNISPGIYFMEIQTAEKVITKRVKIAN